MKNTSIQNNARLTFSRTIILVLVLMAGCSSNNSDNKNPVTKQEEKKETSYTLKPSSSSSKTDIETKPKNSSDPYNLSFTDSSLLFDSDLRNILSRSELEYCSYVIEDVRSSNVTLTWNLKSNDKEVYRCDYSFDKNRSYSERSVIACKISEAYEKYKNGDTALIRDYVMPEKNDDIDMFINENSSSYYEKYFILGKYSDMYCYTKGDDIYFEYYWYQNTDEGPALVYKSTAENTDTTSGQRYRNDLWELFELSYRNIDIIPYNEYPRTKDYYEVYRDWKNKDRDRKEKENLKEMIDIYCECGDEDELYSEYEDDFDSWEEAADFWEEHCD